VSKLPRTEAPERRRDAGFTLVEVLVALSIMSITLAAIGSLMAMSARSTRAVDQRLALIETARAVETGLPSRADLVLGSLSGERAGHRWRVDVLPFSAPSVDAQLPIRWIPARIVIRVQGPAGSILQVETVRLLLQRTGG
jgi:general secretion pathway protein I